jgi:hypothetical protein
VDDPPTVVYGTRIRQDSLGAVMAEEVAAAKQCFCAIDLKGDWYGLPLIEINPRPRDFLANESLRQLYWTGDFVDYMLHRIYGPKLKPMGGNENDAKS